MNPMSELKLCKDCIDEPFCGFPHTGNSLGCDYWQEEDVDVVKVVRCKDCVHAVDIEKDYIRKLFIDGTKQCELGRGDLCYGASIVSHDGFCDSGERKDGAD